jgi:hypothetical protein
VHALMAFAFKEAQEFLANFRAGRHGSILNVETYGAASGPRLIIRSFILAGFQWFI